MINQDGRIKRVGVSSKKRYVVWTDEEASNFRMLAGQSFGVLPSTEASHGVDWSMCLLVYVSVNGKWSMCLYVSVSVKWRITDWWICMSRTFIPIRPSIFKIKIDFIP
ncbi:hypothetical protein YC2023_059592 [Brassica napus]